MTAIPSSALLGQFACDITPAGQAVFGLKAQPFTDNHGAVLGEVFDAERGNVSLALARKASLVAECHRLGLNAAGTTATLRAVPACDTSQASVTGRCPSTPLAPISAKTLIEYLLPSIVFL